MATLIDPIPPANSFEKPYMKKKILIVEDDKDLGYVIEKLLELLGYDSILAFTGKKGVEMAASQLPDLIMLDILLPEMDGFEASRLIRQNPKTRSIPILAVTALTAYKDKQECLQSGCDDYIPKPLIPVQLASRIEKLLT